MKAAYGRLVATAKRTAAQGKRVLDALRGRAGEPTARRLAERLAEVLPRLKRVIGQAERRVLKDDPVPSGEKLVSLFEPHTPARRPRSAGVGSSRGTGSGPGSRGESALKRIMG